MFEANGLNLLGFKFFQSVYAALLISSNFSQRAESETQMPEYFSKNFKFFEQRLANANKCQC